jgi:hypothetical protein
MVQFLQNVSVTLNSRPIGCWGDDYGGTRDAYIQGHHEDVLQGVPVMAYPLCTGTLRSRVLSVWVMLHSVHCSAVESRTMQNWCTVCFMYCQVGF